MVVTESKGTDQKKVRFPPPKNWNPDAKWTQDCVMFKECGEKHAPWKCDAFKKLSPQQRLKRIEERELCHLCRGVTAGRKTKCPTAERMAARRPTTTFCTAPSCRAA
jgi:hypothetical protein